MTEEYFYYDKIIFHTSSSVPIPTILYKDRAVKLREFKATIQAYIKEWVINNKRYKVSSLESLKHKRIKKESYLQKILSLLNYIKSTINQSEVITPIKISNDSLSTLIINYNNLRAIINFLIIILEYVGLNTSDGKSNFHKLKAQKYSFFPQNVFIHDTPIEIYLTNFKIVKCITFALGNNTHDRKLNIHWILLLIEFIEILFPSAYEVHFDLNISDIDNQFLNVKDSSLITEKEILSLAKRYSELFISNYIISRKMKQLRKFVNYSFKIYDSYQLEIHKIFTDELFRKNINNFERITDKDSNQLGNVSKRSHEKHNGNDTLQSDGCNHNKLLKKNKVKYVDDLDNVILVLRNISRVDYIIKIDLEFNAFDPLLFSEIIGLLLNLTTISELSLNLFPKDNKSNLYKTYLNSNHYSFLGNQVDKSIEHNYEINSNDTCESKLKLVTVSNEKPFFFSKDKILQILFTHFNQNMTNLIIILEEKIQRLFILHLNLYSPENIKEYENYQSTIVFFFMNTIKMIQTNASKIQLEDVAIELNDTYYEYYYNMFKKRNIVYLKGFDLSHLHFKRLRLSMTNINSIIPMKTLPSNTLTSLSFHRFSIKDFKIFLTLLAQKEVCFSQLTELSLEFDYYDEFSFELMQLFLVKLIPTKCTKLTIGFPYYINENRMIDIMLWYSHNMTLISNQLQIELYCSINNEHIGLQSFPSIYAPKLNKLMRLKGLCSSNITFPSLNRVSCNIMFIDNSLIDTHYVPLINSLYKSCPKTNKKFSRSTLHTIFIMIHSIIRPLTITFI